MALDAKTKVPINAIRITGVRAFPAEELQALVADAVGRELSLADLQGLADRLTAHYREAGYLLARAYLPAQEIGGSVEIAILEGRLGQRSFTNQSSLSDARVTACLDELREGEALRGDVLERDLLLLSDLPGVEVRSTLQPGASVGTTDLDIRLAPRSPYGGDLELDDYGNRYTGIWRLGGGFSAGNLAGLADTLALRAMHSDGMDYGRLAWQLPVGWAGTQMGWAWSDMRYRLGEDFSALAAHGTATIGSLYLLHPFVRSRLANLNGQLQYEHKRLADDIDSTATESRRSLDVWTLGLTGSRLDGLWGGGQSQGSLSYVTGRLALDDASRALDAAGHNTAGDYDKLSLSASRLQGLDGPWSIYGSLTAQAAGKNLDSSEKLSLGGPQGVRAYPQGEASCDDAWLATLELRHTLDAGWQGSLFYDGAEGRANHRPIASDGSNRRRLAGYGLGLAYQQAGKLSLQLSLAWRDSRSPTSDVDRSPRVWMQAVKRF